MSDIKHSITEKFGADKVMHFGLGGVICAVASIIFNLREGDLTGVELVMGSFLGVGVAVVANVIGECFDDKFDVKDVLAGFLGALCVTAAYAVGVLLPQ